MATRRRTARGRVKRGAATPLALAVPLAVFLRGPRRPLLALLLAVLLFAYLRCLPLTVVPSPSSPSPLATLLLAINKNTMRGLASRRAARRRTARGGLGGEDGEKGKR